MSGFTQSKRDILNKEEEPAGALRAAKKIIGNGAGELETAAFIARIFPRFSWSSG
jgi:hypothetical protein